MPGAAGAPIKNQMEPELGILPGAAGAPIKNQMEPELILNLGPELELWAFERSLLLQVPS